MQLGLLSNSVAFKVKLEAAKTEELALKQPQKAVALDSQSVVG